MVGVPALWEMLHRRIKTRLRDRGDWIADIAENMIEFNAWLRDKTENFSSLASSSRATRAVIAARRLAAARLSAIRPSAIGRAAHLFRGGRTVM